MVSPARGMLRAGPTAEPGAMKLLSRTPMPSPPPPPEPVTVTVARRVAPGRSAEFDDWVDGILAAAADFPGFLGGGALRPGKVGDEWHVVYRYASPTDLERWESSPERAGWLARAEQLMDETGVQRVSGLETWFALPGRTAPAPPRWKMAVVTVLAIVPLVLAMNVLVLPQLAGWPVVARTLVFSGTLTTLMTWVVMPRMTRLFRRFLYGPRR
jgi:antibiotic biosynthesis monooxygenase (ABM) superfamily enzyme